MGGDTAKGCQKPALQQKTTDDDAFLSAFVTEERLCLILSISMFPFSLVAQNHTKMCLLLSENAKLKSDPYLLFKTVKM